MKKFKNSLITEVVALEAQPKITARYMPNIEQYLSQTSGKDSIGPIDVIDLVRTITDYVYRTKKAGFSLDLMLYKDTECVYVTVEWIGDRYILTTKCGNYAALTEFSNFRSDVRHVHPTLSVAAFDALFEALYGHTQEYLFLESDEIEVYKGLLLGYGHRYPKQFFNTLTRQQMDNINTYFIRFYLNHDERTCVETTIKDIIRGKMRTIYNRFERSIHAIVKSVYPNINPWDMVKTASGTFRDYDIRMEAIDYYLGNLPLDEITVPRLKEYIPGAVGYYGHNKIKIAQVRQEIEFWRSGM